MGRIWHFIVDLSGESKLSHGFGDFACPTPQARDRAGFGPRWPVELFGDFALSTALCLDDLGRAVPFHPSFGRCRPAFTAHEKAAETLGRLDGFGYLN